MRGHKILQEVKDMDRIVPWGSTIYNASAMQVIDALRPPILSKIPTLFDWSGQVVSTGKYALVTDRGQIVADSVSKAYMPIQYAEFARFYDTSNGPLIEAATCIGNRGIVLATSPIELDINGDPIKLYLLLSIWNDGKKAISAAITPLRIRCTNALVQAWQQAYTTLKIWHNQRDGSKAYINFSNDMLSWYKQGGEGMVKNFNAWTNVEATQELVENVKNVAFPKPQRRSDTRILTPQEETMAMNIAEMRKTFDRVWAHDEIQSLNGYHGSVWSLYNTATELIDWWTPRRNETNTASSMLIGTRASAKMRVANVIMKEQGWRQ